MTKLTKGDQLIDILNHNSFDLSFMNLVTFKELNKILSRPN